jgi:hypothetical protein
VATFIAILSSGIRSHPVCGAARVQFNLVYFMLIMSRMYDHVLPLPGEKNPYKHDSVETNSAFRRASVLSLQDSQIQFSDLIYH